MISLRCLVGDHVHLNPHFKLVEDFCDIYGYRLDVNRNDVRSMMIESRGWVNPSTGFIVYFNGVLCKDIFELTAAIDKFGCRPC